MEADARHGTALTAAEIGALWSAYLLVTLVQRMFTVFLRNVDDPAIRDLTEYTRSLAAQHQGWYEGVFKAEGMALPRGVTADDILPARQRIFSDEFYLNYINNLMRYAFISYCTAYVQMTRPDIRRIFAALVDDLKDLDQRATEALEAKGILPTAPYIPVPKKAEFVADRGIIGSLLGERPPLSAQEIAVIFTGLQANISGRNLMLAFSQLATTPDIKAFLTKGKDLATDIIQDFSSVLVSEDISIPIKLDADVSEATNSPFTERLMVVHVNFLILAGLGTYGSGISVNPRPDIAALFAKLVVETGKYALEGAQLAIKYGWMEQPPLALKRGELAGAGV